jgi:hypothetical protein
MEKNSPCSDFSDDLCMANAQGRFPSHDLLVDDSTLWNARAKEDFAGIHSLLSDDPLHVFAFLGLVKGAIPQRTVSRLGKNGIFG